ncbi:MAG: hypothetical protein GY847_30520 [Proteobacteria bacterium]|nr:hypothetical protein [Pseudomonadota bacterium]
MRKCIVFVGALAAVLVTTSAFAQKPEEACKTEKDKVVKLIAKEDGIKAEIKAITDELDKLAKKKKELLANRGAKKRETVSVKKEIRKAKVEQKKACAKIERCKKAEERIKKLKAKISPLRAELKAIRKEIRSRNKRAAEIGAGIEGLEKQYNKLNCRNLVAGETPQATIDKCSDIFSKWNALQKDLNDLNTKVISTRRSYTKVMVKMRVLRVERKILSKLVKVNCGDGKQAKDVEVLETKEKDDDAIKAEIDEVAVKIKKSRKIKIVKPKVKKGKAKGKIEVKGKVSIGAGGKAEGKGKLKAKGKVKGKASIKAKTN